MRGRLIASSLPAFLVLLAAAIAPAVTATGKTALNSWQQLSLARTAGAGDIVVAGDLRGRTRILMAWRSDCLPCLIELRHIRKLEQVSARLGIELIALALDEPGIASAKLDSLGVRPARTWYALDDDDSVLAALARDQPALPISIAINRRGELCGRRVGVLGTDIIEAWAKRCK